MSIEKENQSHKLIEDYLALMVGRKVGHESAKTYIANIQSGFFQKYLSGKVLDIGYRGADADTSPIVENATGIDIGYSGYDGIHLPFESQSQDAVYSSHCLEHIEEELNAIREWFRVIRVDGYLVITVPHQFLYEKKIKFNHRNTGHLRFYTPATLMETIELALAPNHYRVRSLRDNDMFYDYRITPDEHPMGCYEIELVVQRIKPPAWVLA
jgi:SAM-dependent methyltransferase